MTWNKIGAIGPTWVSWSPILDLVCDVSSPTATECPGVMTGLTWGDCKYTTFNKTFYGFINLTITNTGLYPYGGTRNHWDLLLPYSAAGNVDYLEPSAEKRVGNGFWTANTSPFRQGKVLISTFPNSPSRARIQPIKVTSLSIDTWAMANLNYGEHSVNSWNGSDKNVNILGETAFPTNSWAWRRLASDNSAWSGAAESWSAPSPTITVSMFFNYLIVL